MLRTKDGSFGGKNVFHDIGAWGGPSDVRNRPWAQEFREFVEGPMWSSCDVDMVRSVRGRRRWDVVA